VLHLLWADFFDLQLPSVRSWNVHVGVKSTKYKLQYFALPEDFRRHTRVDQEISSKKFFQEPFFGDKITSRANHEREREEPAGGALGFRMRKGEHRESTPIPYVEPADPNMKQETTEIKVKLPDGTNYQMVPF
jgi:hypothetical protein